MSRTWIEQEWINNISLHLDRFKWVRSGVANFRCNLCGDSDTNSRKARGHFYIKGDRYSFKCHNCGEAFRFTTYLRKAFPQEYQKFKLDLLKSKSSATTFAELGAPEHKPQTQTIEVKETKTLDELPSDHPAVEYCEKRGIPKQKFCRIHYTDNFQEWVKTHSKGKQRYNRLPKDKRIMFVIENNGKIIGVQGRSITNSSLRYITLKFNDRATKVYGRNFIDRTKPIFVVEGIIDTFFLPNCIALCGGDVGDSLLEFAGCDLILVLDNEPRSRDTVTRMKKAIDLGHKVVIWEGVDSKYKDINDMYLKGGMSPKEILTKIHSGIRRGVLAHLSLQQWQRVGPIK